MQTVCRKELIISNYKTSIINTISIVLVLALLVTTAAPKTRAAGECTAQGMEPRIITLDQSGDKQQLRASSAFTDVLSIPTGSTISIVNPDGTAIGDIRDVEWGPSLCGDWVSQPLGSRYATGLTMFYKDGQTPVGYGLAVSDGAQANAWKLVPPSGFEREATWVVTPTATATSTPPPTSTVTPQPTPVPTVRIFLPHAQR